MHVAVFLVIIELLEYVIITLIIAQLYKFIFEILITIENVLKCSYSTVYVFSGRELIFSFSSLRSLNANIPS